MRPGAADQWGEPEPRRLSAFRWEQFLAERQELFELANRRAQNAESRGEEGKVGEKESGEAELSIKVTWGALAGGRSGEGGAGVRAGGAGGACAHPAPGPAAPQRSGGERGGGAERSGRCGAVRPCSAAAAREGPLFQGAPWLGAVYPPAEALLTLLCVPIAGGCSRCTGLHPPSLAMNCRDARRGSGPSPNQCSHGAWHSGKRLNFPVPRVRVLTRAGGYGTSAPLLFVKMGCMLWQLLAVLSAIQKHRKEG